jgi:hypothetical protein
MRRAWLLWIGLLACSIELCAYVTPEAVKLAAAAQTRAWLARKPIIVQRAASDIAAEQELPASQRVVGEPPLRIAARAKRFNGYRLQFRAPSGRQAAVRIRLMPDGTGQLLLRLQQPGDSAIKAVAKTISTNDVRVLQAYVRIANFWRAPAIDQFASQQPGTTLSLEGAQNGNYRWLSRTVHGDMYFVDACRNIARLAGLTERYFE